MNKTLKTLCSASLALSLAGVVAPVLAAPKINQTDAKQLLSYVNSNGLACMSCHAIDHRVIGPPWQDVAVRYKGKPHAETTVANAIANGNTGLWAGYPPMPAGMATPAQAKDLAKLILHLVD